MSFDDRVNRNRATLESIEAEYQQAPTWLPFAQLEIRKNFSEEELKDLRVLIGDMNKASDENARKRLLATNIERYGSMVVRLLKLAGIIV